MVSVIVPIYNVEPYLRQCIDSILFQTYTDLEILLIDDGSTDGSGSIADSYTDTRIRVFHTANHGLSAARNLGIEKTTGDFILFIDSDDWIEPDLIGTALKHIGSADILYFGHNERHYPRAVYNSQEALSAFIKGQLPVSAWSKLYKRSCFSTLRFPENRLYEDALTSYKLFQEVQFVKSIDYCGYHYRKRPGSITQTHDAHNIIDYWYAHKTMFDDCQGIVDKSTRVVLLESCASAMLHAWAWRNSIQELREDTSFYESLTEFARSHLTNTSLSFRNRIGVFLASHPSEWSFSLANAILKLHRWWLGLTQSLEFLHI